MANDFLWDRTGSDPEIEALEAKLAVFRPSALRAPQMPAAPQPRFRFSFPLRIGIPVAAFASLALALVASFGYLTDVSETPVAVADPVEKIAPAQVPDPAAALSIDDADPAETAETVASDAPAKRRAAVKSAKRNEPRAASAPKAPQTDRLAGFSDEERAAYEQLMLALSVTSSSFRLVQEKLGAESAGIPLLSREESTVRSN